MPIIHVDMDEFFAAVEKLDHPELRGKPLLIGGDPKGRGVVSTASYEARPFGCRSAMPMAMAVRLCPQAIVLPGRHGRYSEISGQIFAIMERFTPVVEPLSIDEAFLDVTGCERLLGSAPEIGLAIKQTIRREIGLTASVGVAPNKFLAKLASDLKKPDGLVVLTEENFQQVLDPLPISKIWGVGPAGAASLEKINVRTIAQLRRLDLDYLKRRFGDWGEHCWRLARGLDERTVTADGSAKSIGQEETFVEDIGEMDVLQAVLLGHVEHVARRLRRHGLRARTVTLKIRDGNFTTITRSRTLAEPTDATENLWQAADEILAAWAQTSRRPLRLLGMTVSGLSHGGQLSLLDAADQERQRQLDQTLDRITQKYGTDTIKRGLSRPRGKQ